jgi:TRAP-type C4-dicarboxylate transport system permease small subunit
MHGSDSRQSFETPAQEGGLLRMRVVFVDLHELDTWGRLMVHTLDAVETPPAPAAVARGPVGRALAFVNHVIVLLSSIALVIASFVLTYSVASRYFLHLSTDWQDELSVFLIVGAVFMSSASIQERRGHVAIDAIVGLLPAGVNHVRQISVDGASFAFCAFFAWKSWSLLDEAWTENFHSESTWGPPLWIPYSLMTVGMTLLAAQILMQIVLALTSRRSPE